MQLLHTHHGHLYTCAHSHPHGVSKEDPPLLELVYLRSGPTHMPAKGEEVTRREHDGAGTNISFARNK